MIRARFPAFWSVVLVLSAACSGEPDPRQSSGVDESKPVLQPDGPLRGLAMVEEASGDGSFSDPQLAFTTDDMEATAVVGLRDDVSEGATLTVAWYRLTGVDGREHLFSHEIPIGPGGNAISQGVSEGGLAPGLYETVATLEDRQTRTPWVVRVADEASEGQAVMGATFALMSVASLAQVSDEDWNVPDSGDSGWYDPEEPGEPSPPGPCEINRIYPTMQPFTMVWGSLSWSGTCSTMSLSATVSGPHQMIASREFAEGSPPFLKGGVDVCDLPGGSDMPETVVSFAATGSDGVSATETYTLPDHGAALVASILSQPEDGSRVEPGDTIDALGVGILMPPALGIEKVSLYAEGHLIDTAGNASGSSQPEPCNRGRFYAEIRAPYRVPDDPPPVIEICAEVVGFDGNESRECAEFYTGEVWKGTVTGTGTGRLGGYVLYEGEVTIVAGKDGAATLEGTFTTTGSSPPFPPQTSPLDGQGQRTPSGFEFSGLNWALPGTNPVIDVSGNHGTGRVTGQGAYQTWELEFEIDCVSGCPASDSA